MISHRSHSVSSACMLSSPVPNPRTAPERSALTDLRTRPLIVPCSERTHPALRRWLLEQCAKAGFKPNIVEEVPSSDGVFDLVQDGVGVAILPGEACDANAAGSSMLPNLQPGASGGGSGIPAGSTHPGAEGRNGDCKFPAAFRAEKKNIFACRRVLPSVPWFPSLPSGPGLIAGGHQTRPERYWTRIRLRVNLWA